MTIPLVWYIVLYEVNCEEKQDIIEKEKGLKNRFVI